MDRIKSAFEIAMERAERLGKASAEELRKMKEAEYASIGEALAKRYLGGEYGTQQLEMEVNKRQDGRDLVIRAALGEILESLEPDNCERAIEGVAVLMEDKEEAKETEEELKSLCREHAIRRERAYGDLRAKLEQPLKQGLKQLGISGSAIHIDVESSPQWSQAKEEMDSQFLQRLGEIKRRLLG